MPEHLRALIVIVAIAIFVFYFYSTLIINLEERPQDFRRRRNLWFLITLTAFLAHNFWIFILFAGFFIYGYSRNENNKISLVLLIALVVPPFSGEIPGFGIARYLFDIDYQRLLSIALLLPIFILGLQKKTTWQFGNNVTDKLLICYVFLNIVLLASASTVTGTLRTTFLYFLDVILPYAAARQAQNSTKNLRIAITSYIIGASILALIGAFEFSQKWLLYSSLDEALGLDWAYGSYLLRDGKLRAIATAGQAIPFGFAMSVAICLMLGLRQIITSKTKWSIGIAILSVGLLASLSRGPWFGALAGLAIFILTSQKKRKTITYLTLLCIAALVIIPLTPAYEWIIYYFGTGIDDGSYSYRQRLLEISIELILQNPVFGQFNYIYSPAMQELKQGQGIIDIVNTYLAIGLSSGLTGISLFTGFFITAFIAVWKKMKLLQGKNSAAYDQGRSLLASLTCILVTIFTVSSITIIPTIYYLIVGLAISFSTSNIDPENRSL